MAVGGVPVTGIECSVATALAQMAAVSVVAMVSRMYRSELEVAAWIWEAHLGSRWIGVSLYDL